MKDIDLEGKIRSGSFRVALVGMGYIGTCIGGVIADRGYPVIGIDIRQKIVDELNAGRTSIAEPGLAELIARTVKNGTLTAAAEYTAAAGADVVIITVGTPLGTDFEPDTSHITAAARAVKDNLRPGQLVILKSTVPPHTTEKIVKPILDEKGVPYYLSFCPERLAEGHALSDFASIPIIIGGVDAHSAELSAKFWDTILGVPTVIVQNACAAELVKLADNLWIDLNIAIANEIAMVSDSLGVDVLEVIAAANSLPKGRHQVNILFPGVGVGGYCLTKDPWFVHHMGKGFGLDLRTPSASRTVNEGMPAYSFGLIESALQKAGKALKNSKVAVLGLSFKGNTGDCRYSPTKFVIEKLAASGCKLELYDPWVSDGEALLVTDRVLNRDLAKTLDGADAVAILSSHDEFKHLTVKELQAHVTPGAVVFDGRNLYDKDRVKELQAGGFIYKGVGR